MNDLHGRKLGELRPSQLLFTYGVGAIVDLPHLSVLVMGLDDWRTDPTTVHEIVEERLLRVVRWELGSQVARMLSAPSVPESAGVPDPFDPQSLVGVPVAFFPRWMVCPSCRLLAPLSSGLFEPANYQPFHPDRTRYVHGNCNRAHNPQVVPARFLVACENGHLDDFPWVEFVHRGPTECSAVLRLIEYGPTGEARDLEVRCETCDAQRRLSDAFGLAGRQRMPQCRGRRPHLRDYAHEPCGLQVKAMLLGASNLWFPDVLTSLAIPAASAHLDQAVEGKWALLRDLADVSYVALLRRVGQLGELSRYTDDEIWQAIERKRQQDATGEQTAPTDLKSPEWDLFTRPELSPNTEDLRLRPMPVPPGLEGAIARVVLVERLREVRALVGFTRIDAPAELDEQPGSRAGHRMRLSRSDPAWVPAAEVRGEGVFVQFDEGRIQEWLGRAEVHLRDRQFLESHRRWRIARSIEPAEANYPGLRYVLLHTFAHALMRQFTLECGYAAASVRERIYSRNPGELPDRPEPMAGVLLYTSAPDSEGTLGGLVSLGEPAELRRHVTAALRDARLCSSDPLCAEHQPSQQGITLHAAACHACLFSPETSCERGNRYLDRSVLVPTIDQPQIAFFPEES